MSKGYVEIVLFINILYLCLSTSQYATTCDYVCDSTGCRRSMKNLDMPVPKYCAENTSTDVSFSLIESGNKTSGFPAVVGLGINPPKNNCMYEMTLLAKELYKKEECTNYEFKNSVNEIHSRYSVCFNYGEEQYKNETQVLIPYIFTACYTVEFWSTFHRYTRVKGNQFLETNYKKTGLTEPGIDCLYHVTERENNTELRFRMNLTMPIVTEAQVRLLRNKDCKAFNNLVWKFDVLNNYLGTERYDTHNKTLTTTYVKHFVSSETPDCEQGRYNCEVNLRGDTRCWKGGLWQQLNPECVHHIGCRRVKDPTPPDNDHQRYGIAYVAAITFLIVTILYLLYIIRFRIKRFRIPPPAEFPSSPTAESLLNRNIVLIYPKGSKKFMSTMSDFRERLSETCHCVVYDWHNCAEWNRVARIGPSDWFSKMLRDKCQVVWIDVPATRLLIAKKYESKNVQIGDFRDAVFPMIFNLSKWDVERSTPCEMKHFIVRFEEYDNFEAGDDPFSDLHGSVRYSMPQDLELLRLNLQRITIKQ